MEQENAAFVWMELARSNSSPTQVRPDSSLTVSPHLAQLVAAKSVRFFSSKRSSFSIHSSVLSEGGSLHTRPPITGTSSRCQNVRSGHGTENTSCGNVCHQLSHALDDAPGDKSHPQQARVLFAIFACHHFSSLFVLLVFSMISSMQLLMLSTLSFSCQLTNQEVPSSTY